jgi:hypothetical protein
MLHAFKHKKSPGRKTTRLKSPGTLKKKAPSWEGALGGMQNIWNAVRLAGARANTACGGVRD